MSRLPPLSRRRLLLGAGLILLAAVALLLVISALSGVSPQRLLFGGDSTWEEMQSRGTWRVGLDPSFPPFEALDDQGRPVGYDVDLAHLMAAEWGLEAEIVAIGFDSLLDAVQTGRVDTIVSAMPYDPRQTKDVTYSPPYFEAGIRLAVPLGSPITGVEDLDGHTVAVEWGSMSDMVGRRLQREGRDVELVQFATPQETLAAVAPQAPATGTTAQAGAQRADALLVDNVTLRLAQGEGTALQAVGDPLESNAYVIVSPYGANELAQAIAQALETLQASGQMRALEDRWFGPRDPAIGP